jgi:signal transduction histidine kinase
MSVANTGPIVPPDQVEQLFEPFARLAGVRGTSDGHHGLGLSIVRAIATARGAQLDARADPAGGLFLTVSFPPTVHHPMRVRYTHADGR